MWTNAWNWRILIEDRNVMATLCDSTAAQAMVCNDQSAHKTIAFGQLVEKVTLQLNACWYNVQNFPSMSWFQLAFATVGKAGCISCQMRRKLMRTITQWICFRCCWRTVMNCCRRTSSFSKTVRRVTLHGRHKSGWPATHLTSSVKMSGLLTHQTSIHSTTVFGAWCWQRIRSTCRNQRTRRNWKLCCRTYGTLCHKSPSTRQSWGFESGCESAWRLMEDISNTFSVRLRQKTALFRAT